MNDVPQKYIDKLIKSRSLHDHMYNHFSMKMKKQGDVLNLSNLYSFVFVRHPFERLVSAFHDKFVVARQLNIMGPFIDYYLRKNNIKKPKLLYLRKGWFEKNIIVSFQNFVEFVLYESSLSKMISGPSGHWWPFSDMCKMCEIEYDYIGKLENLTKDVECILKHFPNYDLLQQMKLQTRFKLNSKGQHDGNMTMDYFSTLSKQQIIDLYHMFKNDFEIGGYDYPQMYIDVGWDVIDVMM